MLKSCKYCGRIHDTKYICPRKPVRKKKDNMILRFRNSNSWKKKRREIKERDLYLCQICIRNLYDTKVHMNGKDISVHHAVSLEQNFSRRLDDDNLLTLCERHHRMAEDGEIPVCAVLEIIRQQEQQANEPPGGRTMGKPE